MAKEKFDTLPFNLMETANKDFLSSEMFEEGEERIYTIEGIRVETLKNEKTKTEDVKSVVYFVETDLKFALNNTNIKILKKLYGTIRADKLVGKKIQIFKTTTEGFGKTLGCLRIRTFVPELKCSVCGKEIDDATYYGSVNKYGRPYCSKECLEKDRKGEQLL